MTLKEELLSDLKAVVRRQGQTIAAQRVLIGLLALALVLALSR